MAQPTTVDEYVTAFPEDLRAALDEVRRTLLSALPEATESISYGIPTLRLHRRNVVHFAGWNQQVSLYPIPEGDSTFIQAIEPYRVSRGTLKFPLGQPVPYDLIARIATELAKRR
ncbi:iron chaperone [Nocardia callitridis]|uniref:Iron chaperone n=1 Tax=Nocardia callitridis TaxID=648753 RepID=A0ABP9KFZ8_9NOCA